MKKNLTMMAFVACAALTIVSCSNDEVTDSAVKQEQQAVTFGTYVGRGVQSRGTVTDVTALQTGTANKGNFGVTAVYTGLKNWADYASPKAPNFMYNQKVTYSDGAWTYSPVKYWPMDVSSGAPTAKSKISFFAYAPYAEAGSWLTLSANTNDAAPYVTVAMPGTPDLTQMPDLVAASNMNVEPIGTVNFVFKHVMSRLSLKAKLNKDVYESPLTSDKTKVILKKITLDANGKNLYSGGKFTYKVDGSNTGVWSEQSQVSSLDLASALNSTSVTHGDYTYPTAIAALEDDNAVSLMKSGEYLFFVPAGSTGLDGSEYAVVEYDIVTLDDALTQKYSISSHSKKVALPAGILQEAQAYELTLTISLDEVKFGANFVDWVDNNVSADINYDNVDHP